MKPVLTGTVLMAVKREGKADQVKPVTFKISDKTPVRALEALARHAVLTEAPISIGIDPAAPKDEVEKTMKWIFDAASASGEFRRLGIAILAGYTKATGDYALFTKMMTADALDAGNGESQDQ